MSGVHRFRAMGCEIVVSGADPDAVAAVFARWESTFSRFLPDSELSRVNASREWALTVSPLFARALDSALGAAAETDGLVDPTLASALEAAGYDRDFDELGDDPAPLGPAARSSLRRVRLDGLILRRPPGVALDLNGVVKSLAVDQAAALVRGTGFVSAGGDLAVRGAVDVGLPGGGAVRVVRGGLATSGTASRRWRRGGEEQHHLVDPRTGRPSASPWLQVDRLRRDVSRRRRRREGSVPARRRRAGLARRARAPGPLRRPRRRGDRERSVESRDARGRVHLTASPAIWYAARASGVAAYVVLTIVVCVGMALGGKVQTRRWPRFAAEDVHRFGGLLVGSLIGIHVLAIAADSFMPFSLTQLVVPLTSRYRPLWTGLGIAAAELLLALAITNRYRKRIPHPLWRKAHYANFAVWGAASLHGMFAGTDRSAPWLAAIYGVSVASVAVLLLWRVGGFGLRSPGMIAAGAAVLSRAAAADARAAAEAACGRGTRRRSASR